VTIPPLFAQDAGQPGGGTGQADPAAGPQAEKPAPQQPSTLLSYAPFVLIFIFFAIMVIPQRRRQAREQAERLAAMKPGARIVTSGGIVGRIVSLKDGEDEIVIKSEDTKFRILKSTVATVLKDDAAATTEPAKS